MSKYRIHIENIGEGANYEGRTPLECDGFVILANCKETVSVTQHDVRTTDEALMIASSKDLRAAARIALAMYESKMEDAHRNPFASIISSIRPIVEDD